MAELAAKLPRTSIPRPLSGLLLAASLLGAAALLLWPIMLAPLQELCAMANVVAESRCQTAPNKLLGYIAMIAAFPAILVLERFWPANAAQSRFSGGLLCDFIWFVFTPVFLVAIIIPVEDLLRTIYSDVFGLGVISFMDRLPLAAQVVFVVLLSDFMGWCAHVLRHKSSVVWQFHAIHHSQKELNYFSTARIHPGDGIAIVVVRFLPFTALDTHIALPAFVVWTSIERVYEMFTHSNVRTNMGPLKYVLVTPQSHRVHHSSRPEHRDQNFGNVFSIWDFMFGTQCLDFDVYPETGVQDKEVPELARPEPLDAVSTFVRLLVYPFKTLKRAFA